LTYFGNQKYEPIFNSHPLHLRIYFYMRIFSILNKFVNKKDPGRLNPSPPPFSPWGRGLRRELSRTDRVRGISVKY